MAKNRHPALEAILSVNLKNTGHSALIRQNANGEGFLHPKMTPSPAAFQRYVDKLAEMYFRYQAAGVSTGCLKQKQYYGAVCRRLLDERKFWITRLETK